MAYGKDDAVLVQHGRTWYPAKIVSIDGNVVKVKWDSSGTSLVTLDKIFDPNQNGGGRRSRRRKSGRAPINSIVASSITAVPSSSSLTSSIGNWTKRKRLNIEKDGEAIAVYAETFPLRRSLAAFDIDSEQHCDNDRQPRLNDTGTNTSATRKVQDQGYDSADGLFEDSDSYSVDFDSDSDDGEDEDETSADGLSEDLDSESDDGEDEDETTLTFHESTRIIHKIVSELDTMRANPTFVSLQQEDFNQLTYLRDYDQLGHDPSLEHYYGMKDMEQRRHELLRKLKSIEVALIQPHIDIDGQDSTSSSDETSDVDGSDRRAVDAQQKVSIFENSVSSMRTTLYHNLPLLNTTESPFYSEGVPNEPLFITHFTNIKWVNNLAAWRLQASDRSLDATDASKANLERQKTDLVSGTFSNIILAVRAREQAISKKEEEGFNVSMYQRVVIDEETFHRERKIEERRLSAGESITTCTYPDCVRGKAPDCNGLCSSHNRFRTGSMSYDHTVALLLHSDGLCVSKIDGKFETPYSNRLPHSPDIMLAFESYKEADGNGMVGHQVIICNDGEEHANKVQYSTEKEFSNLDLMIKAAIRDDLNLLVVRHTYPRFTHRPGDKKRKMLCSLCKQAGKDARLGSCIVVYDYQNRHSEKALKEYEHNERVEVKFVDINDVSTWNLDIETVDFSEEENDDGDNQEVSAGLEILDATTYFMCGELRTIS